MTAGAAARLKRPTKLCGVAVRAPGLICTELESFMATAAPSEPRRAPAAVVHLALAMGGFAIGVTEFASMSLLPFFARDLGVDEPTAGHVISAYALGVVIGAPLIAVLAARAPRRALLVVLMLVFALGNALAGLAPTYGSMVVFRFLSGLPHGAYFGIAALVAASVAPPDRRTQAVGRVMLGLTVATVIGVPAANWLGQLAGWRWCFGIVAGLGMTAAALIWRYAPVGAPDAAASPLRELGALKRQQVWLTLAIGAIGFGGLFAVYTYLASTLMEVTKVAPQFVPLAFVVFGLGMTIGNLVIPRFADRALMPTAGAMLAGSALALFVFPFAAGQLWSLQLVVFAIGLGGALGTVLQTRLMEVAGEAQALAAALNHAAFNFANALGPWLGGLAIHAGFGWTSTGYVGCALALGGLVIWAVSLALDPQPQLQPAE